MEHFRKRIARFIASCLEAVSQPGHKAMAERIARAPGERILEVGVGAGHSLPLYPKDAALTALDISLEMLLQARAVKMRERMDNVQLWVMDAEDMEFADNSFDKVVAVHVASAVANPVQLASEMQRVCKPNGRIILVDHFRNSNFILGGIERLFAPLARQFGLHPAFSLDDFLAETGLKVMHKHSVNPFHFYTVVEARNNKHFSAGVLQRYYATFRP